MEIWVNRDFSVVLDIASCDQQRDFAASVWLRWAEMVNQAGADVTIKSYTGRVLASAGRGLLGPRFHCELVALRWLWPSGPDVRLDAGPGGLQVNRTIGTRRPDPDLPRSAAENAIYLRVRCT